MALTRIQTAALQSSITGSNITDGTIAAADLASGSVTPAKLSTGGPNWDSSSNLGIGTSSPTQKLDVVLSSATAYSSGVTGNGLRLFNSSTTTGQYVGITLQGEPTTGNAGLATIMGTTTGSGNMDLTFSTRGSATLAERMRIDSSGNLGIGTTSPSRKLQSTISVATAYSSTDFDTASNQLYLTNTNTTTNAFTGIQMDVGANSQCAISAIRIGDGEVAMAFGTRVVGVRAERMRIDSSGNFFIGNTGTLGFSSANTVAGFGVASFGKTQIVRDSVNTIFAVQSLQTGGTSYLQEYIKGQTTLGYMSGTSTGLTLSGMNGITFTASQAASGDANTLDDYEEGTWTPAFTGSGTTYTHNVAYGSYVKIGSLVTAQFYLRVTAYSGTNSNVDISGFPFSSANINAYHQSPGQMWSTTSPSAIGLIGNNQSHANLWKNDTSVTIFTASEIINRYFVGSFTYRAAS